MNRMKSKKRKSGLETRNGVLMTIPIVGTVLLAMVLSGGYYLARQALIALPTANKDAWMASKVATARFYAVNLLPKVHGLLPAVTGGSELLFAVDDAHIGAQP